MDSSFKFAFPSNRVHPKASLQQKLNPQRFTQMSPVMAGIVAYLLDVQFVQPAISEVTVASNGAVLARVNHEPTFGSYLGHYDDLIRNWLALLQAASLTTDERKYAEAVFAERIGYYGLVES